MEEKRKLSFPKKVITWLIGLIGITGFILVVFILLFYWPKSPLEHMIGFVIWIAVPIILFSTICLSVMFKMLNKSLSIPIAVGVIFIIIIVSFAFWQYQKIQKIEVESSKPESSQKEEKKESEKPSPVEVFEENEGKTFDWDIYRSEDYGFEIKYPEYLLLYPPLKTYSVEYVTSSNSYTGIKFGEFNNGCSLNIFKTDRNENINPFNETDIPIKMRRYAASEKLDSENETYHFGMSIVSHAVSPEECKSLLEKIIMTFKFLD